MNTIDISNGQLVMFAPAGHACGVCQWCGTGLLPIGEPCDCARKRERMMLKALTVRKKIERLPIDLTDAEVAEWVGRSKGRVSKIRIRVNRRKYREDDYSRPGYPRKMRIAA